jgi:hypothetical protein
MNTDGCPFSTKEKLRKAERYGAEKPYSKKYGQSNRKAHLPPLGFCLFILNYTRILSFCKEKNQIFSPKK